MAVLLQPGFLPKRTKTVRGTSFVQTWGCQMNEDEQTALDLKHAAQDALERLD